MVFRINSDYRNWNEIFSRKKNDKLRQTMMHDFKLTVSSASSIKKEEVDLKSRQKRFAQWSSFDRAGKLQLATQAGYRSIRDYELHTYPDFVSDNVGKISFSAAVREIILNTGENPKKIYKEFQRNESYSHLRANPKRLKKDIAAVLDGSYQEEPEPEPEPESAPRPRPRPRPRPPPPRASQNVGNIPGIGKPLITKYFNFLLDFDNMPEQYKALLKRYRKLTLQLHPDKGGNPEDFKQLGNEWDAIRKIFRDNSKGKIGNKSRRKTRKKPRKKSRKSRKKSRKTRKKSRKSRK